MSQRQEWIETARRARDRWRDVVLHVKIGRREPPPARGTQRQLEDKIGAPYGVVVGAERHNGDAWILLAIGAGEVLDWLEE